jgi:NitT/TauT family transport system ATP-binding protein
VTAAVDHVERASLTLDGVAKHFEARKRVVTALQATTLSIGAGEFVTLVGPSGCGKSTLLNIVAGLTSASGGSVLLDGKPITGVNRRVGYITQQDNLFPWRTLRDNVALPLEIAGMPIKERHEKAEHWLARVGLDGFGDAYPHELSGGMRQRGAIVRTLIYEPPVILMDEPFGPLDAQTRIVLQDLLLSIWEGARNTIIFVTHDLTEAISLSDRVLLMSARPGRIVRSDRVNIARPRNVFQIHEDPEFRRLYNEIWNELRVQVQDANALRH